MIGRPWLSALADCALKSPAVLTMTAESAAKTNCRFIWLKLMYQLTHGQKLFCQGIPDVG